MSNLVYLLTRRLLTTFFSVSKEEKDAYVEDIIELLELAE